MAGHYKCAKITVLVFAGLEILAGLAFIGIGATSLVALEHLDKADLSHYHGSDYDESPESRREREEQARTITTIAKVFSIALIVGGVLSIINGIIGVVGAVKDHQCLLIFHTVVLCLGLVSYCYLTFTGFSLQNLAGLIISSIRVGLVIYLIQLLKNRDRAPRHQPKNVAV